MDKRVNVSIIIALLVQAALGLTWANNLTFEVAELKKDIAALHQVTSKQEDRIEGLGRLEGAVDGLKVLVQSQSSKLDAVIALRAQMTQVMEAVQETRREYRNSNARLWDETRNLRNAITRTPGAPAPATSTRPPEEDTR